MFSRGALLCGLLLLILSAPAHAADLTLQDETLARTAEGRNLLKYLVSCAMPAGATIVTGEGTQRHTFAGSMGLAPEWAKRALSPAEQRLVSACILARTNRFGVPVMLSMRSQAPGGPSSLQADEQERAEFPFYEAAFFGNLFEAQPTAYVCTGTRDASREIHLRRLLRVCSLVDARDEPAPGLSRCRFRIVGTCGELPYLQNGVDYSAETIHIYLPGPR
ncbi:MAG TPA: hypothetical protein VIT92_09305 [Burkholderiaceae bacterium]